MTKKITLFLVLVIFIAFAFNVFAQGRELEIKYPEVQGEQPEKTTTQIPDYVKYVFNFLIGIGGVIALGALIYAGFQWFTSAGSPEKIQNAKDQISAALLGLVILFGSYLILTTINPNLVVFNLKRLRPIISQLPRGVLVCKEAVDVDRAWQLENNFEYAKEYWQQKEIADELEQVLKNISAKCYMVSAGNIRADLDDKITDIYFIPGEQIIEGKTYLAPYGAILYEDSGYEGKSQPIYDHLKPGTLGGVVGPKHMERKELLVNPSSIKPFVLIPNYYVEKYQVVLYQQYNRNFRSPDLKGAGYRLPLKQWYVEADLPSDANIQKDFICTSTFCSPRSIQVGDGFIAILITPDGRSDTFYNEIDNNLDDNLNIVNWVKCKDYESEKPKLWCIIKCCAQPQVKELIIISARIY